MHSRIRYFKSLVLAGLFFFAYLTFDVAPKELFCHRKIRRADGPGDVPKQRNESAWKNVLMICMEIRAV